MTGDIFRKLDALIGTLLEGGGWEGGGGLETRSLISDIALKSAYIFLIREVSHPAQNIGSEIDMIYNIYAYIYSIYICMYIYIYI